jgi:hypothetical protein
VSPVPVKFGSGVASKITPGKAGGGGKTAGSKLIVVATPSALASMMACLKLPGPLSAKVVTTSCAQETEALASTKLSMPMKINLPGFIRLSCFSML